MAHQLSNEPPTELAKAARQQAVAGRGAVLFFQPFLTCHNAEAGTQLGPDIAQAGKEATAEHLIEPLLTHVCASCRGTRDQPGSLTTSPTFASHTFKNGRDPHTLYRTHTHGYHC